MGWKETNPNAMGFPLPPCVVVVVVDVVDVVLVEVVEVEVVLMLVEVVVVGDGPRPW
ncbi:MAG: hypothetical protein P4L20_05680 [Acidimicrobiales bacterium]|nr:hypothetical protein [Acidimicrobiales bacterium]